MTIINLFCTYSNALKEIRFDYSGCYSRVQCFGKETKKSKSCAEFKNYYHLLVFTMYQAPFEVFYMHYLIYVKGVIAVNYCSKGLRSWERKSSVP